jgi:inosose dehydratase
MCPIKLALNADTTPLSISDTLVFKSTLERVREAWGAGFEAVNVDEEEGVSTEDARAILDEYRMEIASGFFHGPFYLPEEGERIFAAAVRKAEFSRAMGQTCVFVSAQVSPPERHAIAGRVQPGEPVSLSEAQFVLMARRLERIARLWKDYGIDLYYHPHAATYVEAPHEIELLLQITDPDLVRFGPDTGHLFFGGGDPIDFIERYFSRLGGIHLKDVKKSVLQRVREEKLNYRQACALGVWTELGNGAIDFEYLFKFLREKQWSGWVIVETDHTELQNALQSSRVSRKYLKEVINL